MINDISFSLFHDFSTSGSGAVFNIQQSDSVIKSCSFLNCAAKTSGACFIFRNSNTNITSTCFFHSHVTTKDNSYYGNAFYIDQSTQLTHFAYLSAYECGYDSSSVGDSTFVTHGISLNANDINFSNCASYEGATFFLENNQLTKLSFLTCINIYGDKSYGIAASIGTCFIDYINFLSSPTLLYTFWREVNFIISISNGIFNNVFENAFSYDNRYVFTLDNCYCDKVIQALPHMKILQSSSIFQFKTIITAEICEKREIKYIFKSFDCYYEKQSMLSYVLTTILII